MRSGTVRQRVSDQAQLLSFVAIFVTTAVTTAFVWGPSVEASFFPVLSAQINGLDETADGRLELHVEGTKVRSCALVSASWLWTYDHSSLATNASDATGEPVRVPPPSASSVATGTPFRTQPLYVVVPMAVRLSPAPSLSVTYYYRCHPLWLTQQRVSVDVGGLKPPPPPAIPGRALSGRPTTFLDPA